jgi:hypothetical protein
MRTKFAERGRSARDQKPSTWGRGFLEQLEARALLGGDPFPDIGLMEDASNPILRLETSYGAIDIEVLANRDPVFAAAYLASFDGSSRDQTVFHNAIDGVALEAGRWSFLGDEDAIATSFFGFSTGEVWIPPVQPQGENLARTVVAVGIRTPTPAFFISYSGAFYFNLQDNAPPAPEGDYAVIARVLGDASWGVVQTIAGLDTVDFGSGLPFPNRGYQTPVREAWTEGDPVTPDLLAQIIDVSIIKPQGATEFFEHTIYSPEGFTGSTINEFVPIENPNDEQVHYEVWARYEAIGGRPLYQRDQLISRGTIAANSRAGVTVSTVDNWGSAAVEYGRPYAIEVRSTLPVSAMLSHYDFGSATGEAFTRETNETWTFVGLGQGPGHTSFLLWHNPTGEAVTITATFRGHFEEETLVRTFTVDPHRRGGIAVASLGIQDFRYSATLEADSAIVAQLSSYDTAPPQFNVGAWTTIGQSGPASTVGVAPLAFEPNADGSPVPAKVIFKAFNPSASNVTVDIELYLPGEATPAMVIPNAITVEPDDVAEYQFAAFPPVQDGPYTLVYRCATPIHGSFSSERTEDRYGTQMATSAGMEYHFAEGFTDPSRTARNVLEEYVTIFNPNAASFGTTPADATITFTFRYTDGTMFTIQRAVAAGTAEHVEISALQEVINQAEMNQRYFYSIEVASDVPVIAQMLHTDATLGEEGRAAGGFSTLGTLFGTRVRLDALPVP